MACSSLEVAIVGAGTAGPAAAIFLSRAGHRVRLFERAPVNLPVGAGFLLQPTGMRVLAELGLLEALLPQTQVIRRLHCLDRRERALLDLHYADVAEGLHGAAPIGRPCSIFCSARRRRAEPPCNGIAPSRT